MIPDRLLERAKELRLLATTLGSIRGSLRGQDLEGDWPVLVCDEPDDGALLQPGERVRGWAWSPAGVRHVSVWLDGKPLGQATLGVGRPDVAAARPDWFGSQWSGYELALPDPLPVPRSSAQEVSTLMVVAEDGLGRLRQLLRRLRTAGRQAAGRSSARVSGALDLPLVREPGDPLGEAGWSDPLVVTGWAIDPGGIERIEVLLDDEVVGIAETGFPREDLEVVWAEDRALGARSGWQAVIATGRFAPGPHRVSVVIHGRSGQLALGPRPVTLRGASVRADRARQERLEAALRCPRCRARYERRPDGLACTGCGAVIATSEFGTLLVAETYAGLDWRQALSTSWGYCAEAAEVIQACAGGLVLDIGAGLRENIPHVIQLDAIPFPTTDVCANAEELPFADESFDGVVMTALLEHVTRPERVLAEARRVCKLGGRIYADFTSVHPYHGFPHHFLNATPTGLGWLMEHAAGAEGTVIPGDPRSTVRLVLEAWLHSLEDAAARERARSLPTGDLLALLREPSRDPELYDRLGLVFPNGQRLIPPTVRFSGVRVR